MNPQDNFAELSALLPEITSGSMFGYPCLKLGRKPFAFWSIHAEDGAVAFKLAPAERAYALDLEGARPFAPKGENHPMRNWVEVPLRHYAVWPDLTLLAFANLGQTSIR